MGRRLGRVPERDGGAVADRWAIERQWQARGHRVIAGVDEAGRGPLAGPVVVAAVVLPPDGGGYLEAVNDSKALTDARRRELYERLTSDASVRVAVALRTAADIDRLNILRATHAGMRECVRRLGDDVTLALVDGLPVPGFPVTADFLVKGGARSASVGAASIVAKVTRDRLMEELEDVYPGYGFARHKGYGTAEHLAALDRLGACPEHRRSFAPVARALGLLPPSPEQLTLGL